MDNTVGFMIETDFPLIFHVFSRVTLSKLAVLEFTPTLAT